MAGLPIACHKPVGDKVLHPHKTNMETTLKILLCAYFIFSQNCNYTQEVRNAITVKRPCNSRLTLDTLELPSASHCEPGLCYVSVW